MPAIDHLAAFPVPQHLLPMRLRSWLRPIGLTADERVEVTGEFEIDHHGPAYEAGHMLMAVVPDDLDFPTPLLDEGSNGVVEFSVPVLGAKGQSENFGPSMSGYDYIVASWGDGSYYSYHLAEKVWMALGLTPRCIGNEVQRLVYDDLGTPDFNVAEGAVSREYHYDSSRDISWQMSNAHLRNYLWMRGARGVRSFFYETRMDDIQELRALMGNQPHVELLAGDWCIVDLREHAGALLLQVWASVDAVSCERAPTPTADNIMWPGIPGPVTHQRADSILEHHWVYLNDKFLRKYEQNSLYDTVPVCVHGNWLCSPSYRGQWSFTECERIGRNIVRVPLRELYKPKPDQEILHAQGYALEPAVVHQADLNEEHVPSKVQRLVDALLNLGDNLSALAGTVQIQKSARDIVQLDRTELQSNGWRTYPRLRRLAQVAPLDMSEQELLARCKSLHELWQVIPDGFLRRLVQAAGCPPMAVRDLRSLKLLQSLLTILQQLDAHEEAASAFASAHEPDNWQTKNPDLAPLFVLNDLRIADAHEAFARAMERLQDLGFDTASLHQGHGRALDFVIDGVIQAFETLNAVASRLLAR